MHARISIASSIMALVLGGGLAPAQVKPAAEKPSPEQTADRLRREWIISQAPKLITDKAKLKQFIAGLDQLNEFEINEMANRVLAELSDRDKQQFAALRAANARERAAQAEWERQATERLLQQQQAAPEFFPAPPVVGFVREPYRDYRYSYAPVYPPYAYAPYAPSAYPPIAYTPYVYAPAFFAAPAVGYFPIVTWLPAGVGFSTQALVSPDRRHVRMSAYPFFSTIGPVHTFNYMTGETQRLPQYDPPSNQPRPPQPVYDGLRTRDASEFRRRR